MRVFGLGLLLLAIGCSPTGHRPTVGERACEEAEIGAPCSNDWVCPSAATTCDDGATERVQLTCRGGRVTRLVETCAGPPVAACDSECTLGASSCDGDTVVVCEDDPRCGPTPKPRWTCGGSTSCVARAEDPRVRCSTGEPIDCRVSADVDGAFARSYAWTEGVSCAATIDASGRGVVLSFVRFDDADRIEVALPDYSPGLALGDTPAMVAIEHDHRTYATPARACVASISRNELHAQTVDADLRVVAATVRCETALGAEDTLRTLRIEDEIELVASVIDPRERATTCAAISACERGAVRCSSDRASLEQCGAISSCEDDFAWALTCPSGMSCEDRGGEVACLDHVVDRSCGGRVRLSGAIARTVEATAGSGCPVAALTDVGVSFTFGDDVRVRVTLDDLPANGFVGASVIVEDGERSFESVQAGCTANLVRNDQYALGVLSEQRAVTAIVRCQTMLAAESGETLAFASDLEVSGIVDVDR